MDKEKEIVVNAIRRRGKITRTELHQYGLGKNLVKRTLSELRKLGVIELKTDDQSYYYWQLTQKPDDAVALPRTHQAGTTGRLNGYGWTAPTRPGAMDAFAIPSRGL